VQRLPDRRDESSSLITAAFVLAYAKKASVVARSRECVAALTNWRLAAGRATPLVRWGYRPASTPNLCWSGGLWGAVGAQLLATVSGTHAIDIAGREDASKSSARTQRSWTEYSVVDRTRCGCRRCRVASIESLTFRCSPYRGETSAT
jgi:hypothetical protein